MTPYCKLPIDAEPKTKSKTSRVEKETNESIKKKNHSMSNWRWRESVNWSKLQKNSVLLEIWAVLQCSVKEIYALSFKQQFKQIVSKCSIMPKIILSCFQRKVSSRKSQMCDRWNARMVQYWPMSLWRTSFARENFRAWEWQKIWRLAFRCAVTRMIVRWRSCLGNIAMVWTASVRSTARLLQLNPVI